MDIVGAVLAAVFLLVLVDIAIIFILLSFKWFTYAQRTARKARAELDTGITDIEKANEVHETDKEKISYLYGVNGSIGAQRDHLKRINESLNEQVASMKHELKHELKDKTEALAVQVDRDNGEPLGLAEKIYRRGWDKLESEMTATEIIAKREKLQAPLKQDAIKNHGGSFIG